MKYFVEVSGRSFGPFPVATIQNWVSSGRVTAESKVSSNKVEWKRADEFPELAPLFGKSGGSSPGATSDPDAAVWNLSVDGQTAYGPYRASDILQWIREGRVKGETLVWRQGENARQIMTEPYFALQFSAPSAGFVGNAPATGATPSTSETQEWYYSVDGIQGHGPYSVSEILKFVEQGRASLDSVVWRHGENARKLRSEPAFSERLAQATAGVNPGMLMTPAMQQMSALEAIELTPITPLERVRLNGQLRSRYKWMWITSIASLVGAIGAFVAFIIIIGVGVAIDAYDFEEAIDAAGPAAGMGMLISFGFYALANLVAWIYVHMFLYSFWKSIPSNIARVAPGYAVGFLFIPLFWLYWVFIAFIGGANDMNKAFKLYQRVGAQLGEKPRVASTGAATMLTILYLLYFFFGWGVAPFALLLTPFTLFLPPLFPPILFAAFFTAFKNSAIQLNNWRAGSLDENDRRVGPMVTLDDLVNS